MTQPRTYYRDESESDVTAILVIEQDEGGRVHVTENRDDVHWSSPYWMPEVEFRANTHAESIEKVGQISEEKFGKVLEVAKSQDL